MAQEKPIDIDKEKTAISSDHRRLRAFYDKAAPFYSAARTFSHRYDEHAKATIIKYLSPFNRDVILDVGTGPGVYAIEIARQAPDSTVTGIDISPKFIAISKERARKAGLSNVAFAVGNIEELAFAAGTFSKIICAGVLSLVPNKKKAVQELGRVLKNGGCLVIREPLRRADFFNRSLAKLPSPTTKYMGLMFGHFSRDFFDADNFTAVLKHGDFQSTTVEIHGSDLLAVCRK